MPLAVALPTEAPVCTTTHNSTGTVTGTDRTAPGSFIMIEWPGVVSEMLASVRLPGLPGGAARGPRSMGA